MELFCSLFEKAVTFEGFRKVSNERALEVCGIDAFS